MKRCIIFAGGKPESRLPNGLDTENAYIIAADSGYKLCKKFGITPDLAVGDFDSLMFIPDDCEQMTFPKEKDDTDLMLAIKQAIERGCTDITILGALGGRFDHTFANIQTLAYIRTQGAWGRILTNYEEIILVSPGKYSVSVDEKCSLSLFSYSQSVKGLTVSGVKYPLENAELTNIFPLGVSNDVVGDKADISFDEGLLLIIQSRL